VLGLAKYVREGVSFMSPCDRWEAGANSAFGDSAGDSLASVRTKKWNVPPNIGISPSRHMGMQTKLKMRED